MAKKSENEERKLEPGKQNALKVLSKILEVLGIIAKVCMWIAIVCVIITAIVVPIFIKDVRIERNEIAFRSYVLELKENEDNKLDIYYKDAKIADIDQVDKEIIYNVLEKIDAKKLGVVVETSLILAIVILILLNIVLKYFVKIMKNLHSKDTPFIMENVQFIRKIAYYMIAIFVVSCIGNAVISFLAVKDFDYSIDLISVGEILLVFIISYVVEYGCKLQEGNETKIYD